MELIELKLAAQVREIGALAPQIVQEKQAHDAAIEGERDAEAALLAKVVALAKPALPAIASAVEFFPDHRGVLIFDGWKNGSATETRGRRVYLLENGDFAETWRTVERDDKAIAAKCSKIPCAWAIKDPKGSGLFIQFRSCSSPRCVVRWHDPKPLISGLHDQMMRQRGKRVSCIIEAQKSTTKLQAILTLLG